MNDLDFPQCKEVFQACDVPNVLFGSCERKNIHYLVNFTWLGLTNCKNKCKIYVKRRCRGFSAVLFVILAVTWQEGAFL